MTTQTHNQQIENFIEDNYPLASTGSKLHARNLYRELRDSRSGRLVETADPGIMERFELALEAVSDSHTAQLDRIITREANERRGRYSKFLPVFTGQ